jgi:hypothetical protein
MCILLLLCIAVYACHAADEYPMVTLSNGQVTMQIYLPDAVHGYYRGSRFDWAGQIASVTCQGHRFYQEWQTPHDPVGNDAGIGPVDEYGMGIFNFPEALGYQQAQVGQTFLKIGVGALKKYENDSYAFYKNYPVVSAGQWRITQTPTSITFEQTLGDRHGYRYQYVKRIALLAETPGFVITRRLKNLGRNLIHISQYCHNLTLIDDAPVGPAYTVEYPFPITVEQPLNNNVLVQGNTISVTHALQANEVAHCTLTGYHQIAADNSVIIRNTATKAGIRISGNYPIFRLDFFATPTTICSEPFIEITLSRKQEKVWASRYDLLINQ